MPSSLKSYSATNVSNFKDKFSIRQTWTGATDMSNWQLSFLLLANVKCFIRKERYNKWKTVQTVTRIHSLCLLATGRYALRSVGNCCARSQILMIQQTWLCMNAFRDTNTQKQTLLRWTRDAGQKPQISWRQLFIRLGHWSTAVLLGKERTDNGPQCCVNGGD